MDCRIVSKKLAELSPDSSIIIALEDSPSVDRVAARSHPNGRARISPGLAGNHSGRHD